MFLSVICIVPPHLTQTLCCDMNGNALARQISGDEPGERRDEKCSDSAAKSSAKNAAKNALNNSTAEKQLFGIYRRLFSFRSRDLVGNPLS